MAGGPCTGLRSRPPAFLDIPSVPVAALQRLVPSCGGRVAGAYGTLLSLQSPRVHLTRSYR